LQTLDDLREVRQLFDASDKLLQPVGRHSVGRRIGCRCGRHIFDELSSLWPAFAPATAAPATSAAARTARAARISRSRFHILFNHHTDGVVPSGNVAEADSRRLAAFVVIVRLEIARGFCVGMNGIVMLLESAKLIMLSMHISGEFSLRGDRFLAPAVSTASAPAPSSAWASFTALGFGRFAFGRFRWLDFQAFAKTALGGLLVPWLGRRLFVAFCAITTPASSAATAAAAASFSLLFRL
jgi:hypothetical protein